MGEATEISKPVYQYEYAGETHVVAAGIPTMLFGHSPTAHSADEPIELLVNPAKPTEIYDPIYERWFARYRVAWGLGAFLVGGISITLFNMLVFA